MTKYVFSWTERSIATLRKLWDNRKSATEIAAALGGGVTRNAVMGKAHRLGLPGRPSPILAKPVKAPKPAVTFWTSERLAELRRLWDLGRTAKEISAVIGETPKHISSKAHAIGLRSRPELMVRRTIGKRCPDSRPLRDTVVNRSVKAEPKPLLEIDTCQCCFPVTPHKAKEHLFCGAPAAEGMPYCPDHQALAWTTQAQRDEARAA